MWLCWFILNIEVIEVLLIKIQIYNKNNNTWQNLYYTPYQPETPISYLWWRWKWYLFRSNLDFHNLECLFRRRGQFCQSEWSLNVYQSISPKLRVNVILAMPLNLFPTQRLQWWNWDPFGNWNHFWCIHVYKPIVFNVKTVTPNQ